MVSMSTKVLVLALVLVILVKSNSVRLIRTEADVQQEQNKDISSSGVIEYPIPLSNDIVAIGLPVTFYLGDMVMASTEANEYKYYEISLCTAGIQDEDQGVLTITVPNNVNLDTQFSGYVMLQLSKCEQDFSESCVFAQNYVWATNVQVISQIIWNLDLEDIVDNPNIYIRVLAGNYNTMFNLDLSFTHGQEVNFKPWTTNFPFNNPRVTSQPVHLQQYWKITTAHSVLNTQKNHVYAYFSFSYCEQGNVKPKGIIVALTVPPIEEARFSLVEQWACPKTFNLGDCTSSIATQYGWKNTKASTFNELECIDDSIRLTADGIFLWVSGWGGRTDMNNLFYLTASVVY